MNLFSRILFKTSPRAAKAAPNGTVFFEFDPNVGADGNLILTKPGGTRRPFGGNARTGTPVHGVKEVLTLTNNGTNVSNGDTVTVHGRTYTFQTTLTNVPGNVKIGASNTASMTNLFRAINASGGTVGTDYAATSANPGGIATNPTGTTVVVTARDGGAKPVAPTESAATLSWAVTTAGVSCTPSSKGDMLMDGTNIYFATVDMTTASLTGWRKAAHSAL